MKTNPIDREPLISMAEAGKYLAQRTGHRPYLCTLYRWALRGVRGRQLETVVVGRQRYTSVEAITRFMHGGEHRDDVVNVVSVRPDQPVRAGTDRDVEALKRRVFKERPRRAGA